MRLIDADKFIETAWKKLDMNDSYLPVDIKEHVLDKMPTVDAELVKNGHWKVHEHAYLENNAFYRDLYECSICGVMNKEDTNYCPWCGAKMEDEEE